MVDKTGCHRVKAVFTVTFTFILAPEEKDFVKEVSDELRKHCEGYLMDPREKVTVRCAVAK